MKMESGGRMMYINSSWHLQEGSSGLKLTYVSST
jgi:hypothetical protein